MCVAVSTVLLIMPAAWHRLAERGENSQRFHRIAGALLLAASLLLIYFAVLWFGLALWRRKRRVSPPGGVRGTATASPR